MAENILTERTERTWELVARLRVMVERLRRVVDEWDPAAARGAAEELPGAVERTVRSLKEEIAELLERIDGEMASMGGDVAALRTEVDTLRADADRLELGRVAAVYFLRPNAVAYSADGRGMYGRVTFDADGQVQATGIDPAVVTELSGVELPVPLKKSLDMSAMPALKSIEVDAGKAWRNPLFSSAGNLRRLKLSIIGNNMDYQRVFPVSGNKVEDIDLTIIDATSCRYILPNSTNLRSIRIDARGNKRIDMHRLLFGVGQSIESVEILCDDDAMIGMNQFMQEGSNTEPPKIYPNLRRFTINGNTGVVKLGDGTHAMFRGCVALEDFPTVDGSAVDDMWCFYQGCTTLKRIGKVACRAGNFAYVFDGCTGLEEIEEIDLSGGSGSKRTNISGTLRNCPKLSRVGALRLYTEALDIYTGGVAAGSPLLTEITIYGIGGGTYGSLDLSSLTAWGDGGEQAARSLTDSLLLHSISREGGVELELKLSAEVKDRLTEEQLTQLEAKNFKII